MPSVKDIESPSSLPGIDEAAEEILPFIYDKRKIVVFGDYDCDGICATAVMVRTLRALGANCVPFLPKRVGEGYGMTSASLDRMFREHSDVALVITVDNGINSVDEVKFLVETKGVSIVVTDHHLPGEVLPKCTIVNPSVNAPKSLSSLCGAAVAFMLANRIVVLSKIQGKYTGGKIGGAALVLAGLATVTDVMPLIGINRIFVHEALRRFHEFAPHGLKELIKLAKTDANAVEEPPKAPTVKDFGFAIGPRINAPGRMATGEAALNLLLCDKVENVSDIAKTVDEFNNARKAHEQGMVDEAMRSVVAGAPAQVIDLPNGMPGVAGIVASRLLENLGGKTPVCVIASGHGSARAPDGFNIRKAFEACSEYLNRFGGHAAAAGFSVKEGQLDDFRAALSEYAQRNLPQDEQREECYDIDLCVDEITNEFYAEVQLMEPFGEGNLEPIFKLKDAIVDQVRLIGADKKHLSFMIGPRRAVWRNHGQMFTELSQNRKRDIYFSLKFSDYSRSVELIVKSISNCSSLH